MEKLEKTKRLRKRDIEANRIRPVDVRQIGDYTVISCKGWYGLRTSTGETIVDPVYDEIKALPMWDQCMLKLKDKYFIYDMTHKQIITFAQPIKSYETCDRAVKIETDDGFGLYSCECHKVVIPAQFAETTKIERTRYLWVRTHDDLYAYYDVKTGRLIRCPEETSECLDVADEDIMIIKVGNTVRVINESSIYDYKSLRRYAIKHHGRISLINLNTNNNLIANIYGNIIN